MSGMTDTQIRQVPPIDQLREHLQAARDLALTTTDLPSGGRVVLLESIDKAIEVSAGPSTPPPTKVIDNPAE